MSEWLEDSLGELATVEIGGTPAREVAKYWAQDGHNGYPWVSIADLGDRVVLNTKEKITKLGIHNSNVKLVSKGSLIMSFKLTIGRAGLAGTELYTNEAIAAVVPRNHRIDAAYLYYVLPPAAKNAITDNAVKGVTLNKQTLRGLLLRFPRRIDEQQRIAEILSSTDQAIEKTEALIHKYQQIKAGLMHDLFTRGLTADGKLRPPREQVPELYQETPIGWIPKDWGYVKISDLCSQVVDCPHSTPSYQDSGIPCIRTADMKPGQLLLEQAYRVKQRDYLSRIQRLTPKKGDIIYSREGERLGIASPVGEEKVCLGQRVMLLRPTDKVDPNFLLWSMNSPAFYRRVVRGLGATTSPHVNVGDIKSILTYRPPEKEQIFIGEYIKNAQAKLSNEELYRKKLLSQKSGLMHDLLTGKVPVKLDQEKPAHG